MGILQKERRKYFRHPISVPLRVRAAQDDPTFSSTSRDISLGGLNFSWSQKLSKGSFVILTIPVKEKWFDIRARVAYSRILTLDSNYEIGVQFMDTPSAFRARLAEEVIQILEYRKKLSRELGRDVSEEEAARQWVTENASSFPKLE